MAKAIGSIDKQPREVLIFAIDFSSALATGATITAIDVLETDSSDLTINNSEISGSDVVVTISGGITGKRYKLSCLISTSNGEKLEVDVKIKVKNL